MKKLLKILIGVVVVFLVVIVGIVVVGGIMADRVAKSAIELGGSYALGVETTLDKVDVQLTKFTKLSVNMEKLHIANPEGFDKPFLDLGSAEVSVDSLWSKVITVPVLSIRDIDMNLLKNDKGSNYKIILDNLKRFESSESTTSSSSSADKEGMKFIIKEMDIQNVKVHMELTPIGGQLTAVDVDLDKVNLNDVGTAGKPVSAGDLFGIIVKAVLSAAINKGGDLIPGDMLPDLQNGLADLNSLGDMGVSVLTDVGGQLTDITGEAAGEVTENAKKGLEDVGKGLGKTIKNPFDKKDKNKDDDGGG